MSSRTFDITHLEDEEGNEIPLPMKRVACQTCDGKGTHVNPSIDGHGISAEEWERDWVKHRFDGVQP